MIRIGEAGLLALGLVPSTLDTLEECGLIKMEWSVGTRARPGYWRIEGVDSWEELAALPGVVRAHQRFATEELVKGATEVVWLK